MHNVRLLYKDLALQPTRVIVKLEPPSGDGLKAESYAAHVPWTGGG